MGQRTEAEEDAQMFRLMGVAVAALHQNGRPGSTTSTLLDEAAVVEKYIVTGERPT